ncbi:ATP-binding protein [Streptomyces coacervatus]|uniref:ATP-binding protein n=1 Tax=Streptomyces coacervatus TaxID=647381 RepID=A0ABP7HMK9_9ACTN|nr:ATP-binding protein [Streptomyces coacervatus]MDF2272037.1 ATP-binding protein [Streptomyces coacervatus]
MPSSSGRRPLATTALVPPTAPDWGLALGISTSDFAARAFTCEPTSLQSVRRFVRETISAWGLNMLAEDMTTVVNELTTNAVRHALDGCAEAPGKAWLGIARTGGAVVCAVTDPSSTPPTRRHPERLAEAGRGLLVVDALTGHQWGYAQTAPDGKTVWARLTTPRC